MDQSIFPTLSATVPVNVLRLLNNEREVFDAFKYAHCYRCFQKELNKRISCKIPMFDLPSCLKELIVAPITRKFVLVVQMKKELEKLHMSLQKTLGHECLCPKQLNSYFFSLDIDELSDVLNVYKGFMQDERRDVACRFLVACEFQIADDILQTWEQLSEARRNGFMENDFPAHIESWIEIMRLYEWVKPTDSFGLKPFLLSMQDFLANAGNSLENIYPDVYFEVLNQD